MSNTAQTIEISSHKGPYSVFFIDDPFVKLKALATVEKIFIILDKNVSELYQKQLADVLSSTPHLIIEATEENKDLSQFTDYAKDLANKGVKRNVTLVAIGGGIIQDITCFLASTMFRGLSWTFFPTTLLAQADSCIGSKSSINVGGIKNLMGTFTPPRQIFISLDFLKTLKETEILSGIGEMIKVHGIAGATKLNDFSENYELMRKDDKVFTHYLVQSLLIKKEIIQVDEFDTGPRLVMNYGHTFGHALESATSFAIPHGIAITIGQSMACSYSQSAGLIPAKTNNDAQALFHKNMGGFNKSKINFDVFMKSIAKDKKNVGSQITLIVPKTENFNIERHPVEADDKFKNFCLEYFKSEGFNVQ